MRIYFYHTQDIDTLRRKMESGECPSHLFYGARSLAAAGIDVVYHARRGAAKGLNRRGRIAAVLGETCAVALCREHYDVVYATHYQGLELIILLRALRLFRRPVVVWLHQPLRRTGRRWRDALSRLFYRGIDHALFFAQSLLDASAQSGQMPRTRMSVAHWGADIGFYDSLPTPKSKREGFISTGKELRDMPTLIAAFNAERLRLDIYIGRNTGGVDYATVIAQCRPGDNIRVNWVEGLCPYELSLHVTNAACVVICCQPSTYTVGLTTLVEALALGLPVVCSRNENFPIDIEEEGCGIAVDYGDVEGWRTAIRRIADNPIEAAEMGRRGRLVAEHCINDNRCAADVEQVLKKLLRKKC